MRYEQNTLARCAKNTTNVMSHFSLGNLTPLEARRTLALPEGSAPVALAMKQPPGYQSQTGGHSYERGTIGVQITYALRPPELSAQSAKAFDRVFSVLLK